MEVDGTLESRLILLCKVARRLSTRDLYEEFCLLRISTLARDWGVTVKEDEEVLGLPRLVLPSGSDRKLPFPVSTLHLFVGACFWPYFAFRLCFYRTGRS